MKRNTSILKNECPSVTEKRRICKCARTKQWRKIKTAIVQIKSRFIYAVFLVNKGNRQASFKKSHSGFFFNHCHYHSQRAKNDVCLLTYMWNNGYLLSEKWNDECLLAKIFLFYFSVYKLQNTKDADTTISINCYEIQPLQLIVIWNCVLYNYYNTHCNQF